ncbi:MAG: TonB-dependent receptor, partial [Acidimicrobiia bacterium]|nr:TonB-dependent receptor [Acidimicrobiia bacterium]
TDGLSVPDATITVTSPVLQGTRTVQTGVSGVYILRALPAGTYSVEITAADFQPATRDGVHIPVGGTTRIDAVMSVAAQAESVTVTAEIPATVAGLSTGETRTKAVVDALPIGRRPVDIAELAPGLTNLTYAANQLSISGAFGYDNVFMVNGVDVNDNVIGSGNDLFIEDAIQETTVLTAGLPPSYGRFSGGVVNVVTRSGGNVFSGSYRHNVSNPAWVTETPRQVAARMENTSTRNRTIEGTVGGPILTDRLWFFTAGRTEGTTTQGALAVTTQAFTREDTNRRGELKFTATVAQGQTAQVSYISNTTTQANVSGYPAVVDRSALITRERPNELFAANYRAALGSSVLATVQYSSKHQGNKGNGGTSTRIMDSPFITAGALPGVPGGMLFHAPYFDANDPESRDNRQIAGSLSALISTWDFGTHDLNFGAEHFVATGRGGNSQSSTGYVFSTDFLVLNGAPVIDNGGKLVPLFLPGISQVWTFEALRGAEIAIKTTSVYAQERWIMNRHLTLDTGVRAELARADATPDLQPVDALTIVPRLGAAYDVAGDGRTVVQATYGHYTGKYGQVQFGASTNVGRPNEVDYVYTGPAGGGAGFEPGFDLANYTIPVHAAFPTENIRFADGITSPLTRELTLAVGRELGRYGNLKATWIWRSTSRFVEDRVDTTTGVTDVEFVGKVANRVFDNSDEPSRGYQALSSRATCARARMSP